MANIQKRPTYLPAVPATEAELAQFTPADRGMMVALLDVTGGGKVMFTILEQIAKESGFSGMLPARSEVMLWKAAGVVPSPAQMQFASLLFRAYYVDGAIANFDEASRVLREKLGNADKMDKESLWNINGSVMTTQRPVHEIIMEETSQAKRRRGEVLGFSKGAKKGHERWQKKAK